MILKNLYILSVYSPIQVKLMYYAIINYLTFKKCSELRQQIGSY